jgi:sugar phosphate isomerase/epimerase
MKLGVSSYSFNGDLKSGKYELTDLPALAKKIGFDEIEFVPFGPLSDHGTAPDYAKKLKAACKECGIDMGNYTVAGDFLSGSGGDLEGEVERLKGEVLVAQILGSPGMRHDAAWGLPADMPHYTGFDDVLPRLADGCRKVTEYAHGLGIRTMVENHGYFAQDSDRVEKLVRTVGHPNFGLLVDMGNFMCADEEPHKAVGRVARYAFHFHVKDFHWKSGSGIDPGEGWFPTRGGNYLRGAIAGHGVADVYTCLKIMKKSDYKGTVSLEFEGLENPEKGISLGLGNIRRFLDLLE